MTNLTPEQMAKCREAFDKWAVSQQIDACVSNQDWLTWQAAWSAAQPQVDILRLLAEIGNIANGIRARDGAPSGYCPDYFDNLVERIHAVCGGDCLRYLWATTPPTQPSDKEES